MATTYVFSEELIKNRKIMMALMALFIPVSMTIFLFSFGNGEMVQDLSFVLKLVGGSTLFFSIELVIISKIMFKKLRTNTLILKDLQFHRSGGRFTESKYYADITKLKIYKTPKGTVEFIKINSTNGSLKLAGYENMNEISDYIKSQVDPSITIIEKHWKVNWNNPYVSIIYFAAIIILFIVIDKVDGSARHLLSPVINLILSLYFLIFKPVSKSGGYRFKIFEIIVGGLLLILSLYNLSNTITMINLLKI